MSVPPSSPEPPRRDQVLAFIIEQIARSGISPSYPEISRVFGFSETRAKQLVAQLIKRGLVETTPGAIRSFRVRNIAESRIALEEVLRRIGWAIAEPMGALHHPFPSGNLPMMPPFEHLPDPE